MKGSGCSSSAWPTATVNDATGSEYAYDRGNPSSITLKLPGAAKALQASAWPTPTTRDWKDTGDLSNVPENALLGRVAANWSTPRSTDGEKGGPNQQFGAGGAPLPAQTAHVSASLAYSHRDPETSTHGGKSSPERRTLNPLFVAWLMGWPQPASTGCGFSETEWSRFKQRMRSELLRLEWRTEALPAQLALFA